MINFNLPKCFVHKIALSLISLLFISINLNAQITKKVLFIGNSYTGVNNLPSMVSQAATSAGDVLIYDSHTPGGARFLNHAVDPTAIAKMGTNTWDYVVLQAQSQEPSWALSQLQVEVFPYAKILSDTIRHFNTCSNPMFYMTWGRKNGDASNCVFLPYLCTYDGMDSALRASYTHMAVVNKAEISPVGPVWHYIRDHYPDIELYSSDESHPSVAGSYAAACAFYTTVFKKDPTLITWNSTLNSKIADTIRYAAKMVALDSLQQWDYTESSVTSDFTFVKNMNTVSFTNQVQTYDSLKWFFGDGNISSIVSPIHTYTSTGTYNVSLKTYLCNNVATKTISVNVDSVVGISSAVNNTLAVNVYPNPVKDILNVEFNNINSGGYVLRIYNSQGILVVENYGEAKSNNTHKQNIGNLAKGVYFIQIISGDKIFSSKILKD